jgi:hypothetical protein
MRIVEEGLGLQDREGELAMVSIPGATPTTFYFTVRDAGHLSPE